VRPQLIIGILIAILAPSALSAQVPAPAAQDIGKMEQVLKEAGELQSSQPQAVAEKLAPLLAELRPLRQSGTLAQDGARILQDALVLLMRTQTMLLLPEAQITVLARELLTTNPRIDESIFNPREKLLLQKIRSAETGRFVLQTTPPGAVLIYLGTELGKTPAEVPLVSGAYRFQLRLPGYLDQDFEATIQPSEIVTEARTLRRRTVEIPVAINAPATAIMLNGKSLGVSQGYNAWLASLTADSRPEWATIIQQWNIDRASFSFFRLQDVPVGEDLKIEFQAACYQPAALQFMVQEAEVDWTRPLVVRPELRRVELKRDTGFLEVSSTPSGAEVWLDGVSQGQTPIGKDVCVGAHRVQIWHRSGQYVQEVNIRRGQASKVAGDLKPALAFLGIFSQNPQNNQPAPLSADWETVARRIALRSTAFLDTQIAPEDIEAMRKKGALPIEQLVKDGPDAAATDMLIRNISAEAGRADLLLVGLRTENRYIFRLYSTIHPVPDLIEIPALDETSLDFLIAQLNNAEKVVDRLRAVDLGIEMMDTPKGLMIVKAAAAVAAGKTGLAPGSIVRTVDQKPMNLRELQGYLHAKKSGQTITLEVQAGKEPAVLVPVAIRLSGTEYPWNTPDGFANSVLAMMRHLVERDPLSEDAKYAGLGLARGLMRQKEWKQALELLAKTNLDPHKAGICPGTVLYYQGRCLEEMGDRTQAETYYARAKDYVDATIGMPGGPAVPALAEQRIQSLKKLPGITPEGTEPGRR
jgi:hypothetical protein